MILRTLLAASLALAITAAQAQRINFNHLHVSAAEIPDIETALGITGDTEAIDGVALAPSGDIYIIHRNDSLKAETFLRMEPGHPDEASVLKTDAQIATDLGAPFSATMILEGGFATDPTRQVLYFAESFNGEKALLAIDLTQPGNPARVVLRSNAQLGGMEDFAVLPNGNIVIVRGEEAGVGVLNPNAATATYQEKLSRAEIATLTGGAGDPESVTVHPLTGDVYVFCHVVDELLLIRDIESASPQTTVVTPAAWGTVDLHDMAMDEDGTLYGFDEAGERIVILTAEGMAYSHTVAEILEAAEEGHGHTHSGTSASEGFAPLHGEGGGITLWRGMAATKIDNQTAVLYLALSKSPEFGVLQVMFEPNNASVGGWIAYE